MSSRTAEEMDRAVGPRDASRGPWLDTAPPVDVHAYIPASRRPVALRGNLLRIFIGGGPIDRFHASVLSEISPPLVVAGYRAVLGRATPPPSRLSDNLSHFQPTTIFRLKDDRENRSRRSGVLSSKRRTTFVKHPENRRLATAER